MRIGINGFGRMGRLALRAGWQREDIQFVAINEPNASAENMALLLEFDSVQGRLPHTCSGDDSSISIDGHSIAFSGYPNPADIDWDALNVELVLECSGKYRTASTIQPHLDNGAKHVIVSAPVKDVDANIVVGVNHQEFDLSNHPIITAASCTTNCLAPVVRVIHDALGIERGIVTTIHDPTNTQRVHDAPCSDPRRARASMLNLIPTSTNSAYAVTMIMPQLKGKLESIAVRAPVLNASLTDCVFQVQQDTAIEEVNAILKDASESDTLRDILGYESRPLVSSDYARDPRSSIIDAQSTRVTDKRLVKILAWYDNEWGYANRMVELTAMVANAVSQSRTI